MRKIVHSLIVVSFAFLLIPSLTMAQGRTTRGTETTRTATRLPATGTLRDGSSYAIKRGKLYINDALAAAGKYTIKSGVTMVFDGTKVTVDRAGAAPTPHP